MLHSNNSGRRTHRLTVHGTSLNKRIQQWRRQVGDKWPWTYSQTLCACYRPTLGHAASHMQPAAY